MPGRRTRSPFAVARPAHAPRADPLGGRGRTARLRWAGRAPRADAEASTSRSRSDPSPPPSHRRRLACRRRLRRGRGRHRCHTPCEDVGRSKVRNLGASSASPVHPGARLQASSHRRSACTRRTIPSSNGAAGESSGSPIAARWASRKRLAIWYFPFGSPGWYMAMRKICFDDVRGLGWSGRQRLTRGPNPNAAMKTPGGRPEE
jgi:hypothetical protein